MCYRPEDFDDGTDAIPLWFKIFVIPVVVVVIFVLQNLDWIF